jgi:hypothetical protein
MMIRILFISICGVIFSGILPGCSLNNLAGGTGVGNPGGVTTVSIIAHSDQTLQKYLNYEKTDTLYSGAPEIVRPPIPIQDEGQLLFEVTTVVLTTDKMHFLFSDTVNPSVALKDFHGEVTPDSQGIVLTGPIKFNAMTGICIPSLNNFFLPETYYSALEIFMGYENEGSSTTLIPNVTIEGLFSYKDTVRIFSIMVFMELDKTYENAAGDFLVSSKNTSRFMLLMNAAHWLDHINFKQMLDDKIIQLNSQGNLIINEMQNDNPYKDIKKTLRKNVPNSGVLLIAKE